MAAGQGAGRDAAGVREELDPASLPCPACRASGVQGTARIGNRRGTCATCNAFAQRVRRVTAARMREAFADQYAAVQRVVEVEVYRDEYHRSTVRDAAERRGNGKG